jgi:hypothetical protein
MILIILPSYSATVTEVLKYCLHNNEVTSQNSLFYLGSFDTVQGQNKISFNMSSSGKIGSLCCMIKRILIM